MKPKVALTCPNCVTPFETDYSPQIDVIAFPDQEQLVISGALNERRCPKCKQKFLCKLPFVYWSEDWVGVVLESGPSISEEEAISQSVQLLQETRPNRDQIPSKVYVLSCWDDLCYILRNPEYVASTRQLTDMVFRDYAEEAIILGAVANTFLVDKMPECSFWAYYVMITYLPDLYFDPDVREALEITALEAGDKLAPMTEKKMTVAQALEELEQHVRSLIPNVDQLGGYDLFWCTPTNNNGTTQVQWAPHLPISAFDQAKARLLITLLITSAQKIISPSANENIVFSGTVMTEIEYFRSLMTEMFKMSWDKISREEQLYLDDLCKHVAGSSLINDSKLRLKDGIGDKMEEDS